MKARILSILLLAGCGCVTPLPPNYVLRPGTITGPPELMFRALQYLDYCKEFNKECRVYDLSIKWVKDIPGDLAGQCELWWAGPVFKQRIIVKEGVSNDALNVLVAHEMTHCTRFVDHHPGDEPHVMRSYLMNSFELMTKTDYDWIKESFDWNQRLEWW